MNFKSGTMPSVMSHDFSKSPRADIPRSSFNRSHGFKSTFNAGDLIPVFVDEVLPGDTFNLNMSHFARMATPIVPIMDNLYLDSFFFFVPTRLVWDNWQKFNGEQIDPGDSTDFLTPICEPPGLTGWIPGSLADYFGIPLDAVAPNGNAIAFPFRAYNLIWNEWFRDENLQNSLAVPRDDGPDPSTIYFKQKRGKRHDYFTSALPWPQKGPAVTLPLGTSADILRTPNAPVWLGIQAGSASTLPINGDINFKNNLGQLAASNGASMSFDPNGGLYADLTTATAATINQLRQAFQLQKLYERDARGGTRYTEIIRSHFGVTSPDARLQRPEYLGGKSTPIIINPIAQTSSSDGDTPQGNLAAIGTSSGTGSGFTKSFTEHGIVLGLVSIRADLNYQQGLNRMWSRRTRWDFYWPALSHIGEQAVLNKEIYMDGTSADEEVFGYQERYAEYRYKPSIVTGQFRSTDPQTLDIWHLAQYFETRPTLNYEFIEENPPVDRIIAVPSEPQFLFDAYFNLKCARPMPTYSVPGLIDHF